MQEEGRLKIENIFRSLTLTSYTVSNRLRAKTNIRRYRRWIWMQIQIKKVNTNTEGEYKYKYRRKGWYTKSRDIFRWNAAQPPPELPSSRSSSRRLRSRWSLQKRKTDPPGRCKMSKCLKIGMFYHHGNMKPLHWGSYSRYQIETNISLASLGAIILWKRGFMTGQFCFYLLLESHECIRCQML